MEQSLVAFLLASAGLTGLTGTRIHWVKAPPGVTAPYVVLTLVSSPRDMKMSGPSGLRMSRVQADCYGPTYASAKGVAQQVEARLSGYRGATGTTTFDGIFLDSERDGFEDDATPTDLHRVMLDFLIWHKET